MTVQLLPFQKVVDMPDLAQRHRRAICGFAIASIVLIFIILCLLVTALISGIGMTLYSANVLFTVFGIPSMVILLILVCTSSCISLRNTNTWVSTDVCCNLMRSHPTCCTKSCAGNKHYCARMSCLHTAASVWTSFFCVLLVVLLFAGCSEPRYTYSYGRDDNEYRQYQSGEYDSQYQSDQSGGSDNYLRNRDAGTHTLACRDLSEKTVKVGTRVTLIADRDAFQKALKASRYYGWDDAMTALLGQTVTVVDRHKAGIFGLPESRAGSGQPVWWYPFSVIACVNDNNDHLVTDAQRSEPTTRTSRTVAYTDPSRREHEYRTEYTYGPPKYACGVLAAFEVPALILMICLVATTASSAWLLRKIEQGQPEIALLPAGKMVVQVCEDNAMILTGVVGDAHVMNDEKSTTDLKTDEQNV